MCIAPPTRGYDCHLGGDELALLMLQFELVDEAGTKTFEVLKTKKKRMAWQDELKKDNNLFLHMFLPKSGVEQQIEQQRGQLLLKR